MSNKFRSNIVDHNVFVDGHTFSFQAQPYLKELFEAVRSRNLPLTLVVGAGVSMNASLPSWHALITKMADAIEDVGLREIAKQDRSDPMRKAEVILHLAKWKNANPQDHEIIRDALYQKDLQVTPGLLADSISRLVCARSDDTRLLTTNFDIILEEALTGYFDEDQVESFSIGKGRVAKWNEWTHGAGQIGVLHLHGLVRQGQGPEEPIILTESQFLKYGAQVRTVISNAISESCSIFIGLGMSDPNLIGPLYDSVSSTSPRFALVVPEEAIGDASSIESARYAISAANYLEEKLGLKPVFLKSYSQLNQVISDLALAVVEPVRYSSDAPEVDSLVYGLRLGRALDDCYAAIGCTDSARSPVGDAADELSARLHRALTIPGGPVDVLKALSPKYGGLRLGGDDGENFGLFLWLRTRDHGQTKRKYAINLVGTSAYTHREEWSLRHEVEISRDSQFAAAQAIFTGNSLAVNVPLAPNARTWRGILAAPIRHAASGSDENIGTTPADILTIGAVTLNSTHLVKRGGEERDAAEQASLIRKLDSKHYNDLLESLQKAAEYVLDPA